MKTTISHMWSLGLALAIFPWVSGCDGQLVNSASAAPEITNQDAVATPPETAKTATNASVPDPAVVESSFENAPATVVSSPTIPAKNNLSAPALEIVKLAQAGVDEGVMMAYVTNSQKVFSLTSEDIIYLNDLGVPDAVVTAMMQQDQSVKAGIAAANASAPTVETNEPEPESTPYQPPPVDMVEPPVAEAPLTPPDNSSYTYFYDSLAPYGTWVNVAGYGYCWQPTVVAVNPGWSPYCDRGHWVYTDCGWYWASDYSWGWAPFHYGRWFQHAHLGWCWAPDTVWGPSWVSWRYSNDYCGWAPLPPYACYTPGIGFTYYGHSVAANFTFGIGAGLFTFVPTSHFHDHHLSRHRLSVHDNTRVFNNTVYVNQVVRGSHNRLINRGVPVSHITAATRTQIHPVRVEHTDQPGVFASRRDRTDRATLTAFSPKMPQPDRTPRFVGQGVQPAAGSVSDRINDRLGSRAGRTQTTSLSTSSPATPNQPSVTGVQTPRSTDRRDRINPTQQNQPSVTRIEPRRDNSPSQAGRTGVGLFSTQNQNQPSQNQPSVTRNDGSQGNVNRQTGGTAGRREPFIIRGSQATGSADNTANNSARERNRSHTPSSDGFAANNQQPSEPALPLDNSRTPRRDHGSSPWQPGVQQQQQQQQPLPQQPQNPFIIRNQSPRQESPRSRQQDSQNVQTAPLQPVQTYRWPQAGAREQQREISPPVQQNAPASPQLVIPQNRHSSVSPQQSPGHQSQFGGQGSFAPPPQNITPPPQAVQGQGQMRSGNGNEHGNGRR